jgi:hypothetical protein
LSLKENGETTIMNALGLCFAAIRLETSLVKGFLRRMALSGAILAGVAGCGSAADDSASSDQHLQSAAGSSATPHTPAVGSAERTAFMDGVRKVFDARIRSTATAQGRPDVEFAVHSGAGSFLVGSRDGVNWGFLAATAQDPATHAPFDFSHAPPDIQELVRDEDGHPNPNIIAIMQLRNGAWIEAVGTGAEDPAGFFLAPGDVSWTDWPCKADAPFGVLMGAASSPSACGGTSANAQCAADSLTKVPAGDVEQLVQDFREMDDAKLITVKKEADSTFTVSSSLCGGPPVECLANTLSGVHAYKVEQTVKDARELDGSDTIVVFKTANGTYDITSGTCP